MDENPGTGLVEYYLQQRRRGALIVISVMVALFIFGFLFIRPAPIPLVPPPTTPDALAKIGIHLLLDDGRGTWPVALWRDHIRYAAQVVGEGGYVVEVIRSDDLDVDKWQQFMDIAAEFNLTPILRFGTVYDGDAGMWEAPPQDDDGGYATIADDYAAFISGLDWPDDNHYVIIGNEPNHGEEWGGVPDPAAYARYLIDVSEALRAADSNVIILNAAFDPYTPHTNGQPFVNGMVYMDAESFMDGMVAAYPDVFTVVDVWNSHVYPMDSFRAPPWRQSYGVDYLNGASNPAHVEPPDGIRNRGVNGYEWDLWKLETYGITNLPVMVTEIGWRHSEASVNESLDFVDGLPDANTAALYLDMALWGNDGRYTNLPIGGWTPLLTDDRVLAVIPFALNGNPAEWGHTNWLTLSLDGTVTGTTPLFDMVAGWQQGE